MIGILMNAQEVKEMEYLIKHEMEEILFDLQDDRLECIIKQAMDERYQVLIKLFRRIAPPNECLKYMRSRGKWIK